MSVEGRVGWICPRCNRSNAPHVTSCICTTELALEGLKDRPKVGTPVDTIAPSSTGRPMQTRTVASDE